MGMSHPFNPDYRISDTERQQAMEDLGAHFAAGRLTMEEYDERLTQIAQSVMKSDLYPVFDDLPTSISPIGGTAVEASYSVREIDELRSRGRNVRLGILGLAAVLGFTLEALVMPATPIFLFTIVPVTFIVLYVLKLGPKEWHTPSSAKLERARLRELKLSQSKRLMELEIANAQMRAEQKAIRQQQQAELTNNAMDLANQAIRKWRQRK